MFLAVSLAPVPQVGAPLHSLADETRPLRVGNRPLVEAVDLELEPVVVEIEDQVPLDQLRRRVSQPPAAEVRVNGKPLEERDAAPAVADLESERPRRAPLATFFDLDQEAAELLRLRKRAVDLVQEISATAGRRSGEKRLDLLVRQQLDEEVDILPLRAAQPDAVTLDHGAVLRAARRRMMTLPEPSATPDRIRASAASAVQRSGSPRIVAP